MERSSTSVTNSAPAISSGKGISVPMESNVTGQLGEVKPISLMIVGRTDTMSMAQGLMISGKDVEGGDSLLRVSSNGVLDVSLQNGMIDTEMVSALSMESVLVDVLEVVNNPIWQIEELGESGRKNTLSDLPLETVGDVGGSVVATQPGASDMAALENILANMEPAAGENGGGASRAGGNGFGSTVDPAILMGLDRLGGILSTSSGLGGDSLRDNRLAANDLVFRTVSESVSNRAESSDDTKFFDGSNGVAGVGNVLDNDASTSGSLVLKTITFNGITHAVPETGALTIVGMMGTLVIDALGDYSYTPLDAGVGGVDIGGVDLFEYSAQDSAGIVTTATLAVTVNDKIPVAVDDVIAADHMNLVRSGNLLSGDSTGNGVARLAFVKGQAVGPEGITIDRPDLGYKIVISADGSYTMTADNLKSGTDTLTYSSIDADGDISEEARVAISFADTAPTLTSKAVASTNMTLVTTGSILSAPDTVGDGAVRVGSVAGQVMPADGSLVLDTSDYTLTIQSNGDYRLEGKNGRTATNVQIPITTVDSDGDISNTAVITVSVRDRVPEVMEESTTVRGGLNVTTQAITGTINGVLVPDTAGDGTHRYELISPSVGRFGTITLGVNGSYRYELNSTKDVLTKTPDLFEKISYRVTDEDGDTSVSDLYIVITSDGSWAVSNLLPKGVDETVTLEGALNIATQQIIGTMSGNVLSNGDTVGNNPAVVSLQGTGQGLFGSIVINTNGSYTYTLDGRATKTSLQGPLINETFIYEITDADGDISTAVITIQIRPDGSWSQNNLIPVASGESVDIDGSLNIATQRVTATISGTVLDDQDNLGDGLARVELLGSSIGSHGQLTLNADGSYSYALDDTKSNLQGTPTDTFTYRIIDRDGDRSDFATLTIKIESDGTWSQDNLTPEAFGEEISVIGSLNFITQRVKAVEEGTVIDQNDNLGDGLLRVELVGSEKGAHGTLTLNADGTFSYALDDTKLNLQGTPTDTFTYRIIDRDGDISEAELLIRIKDDGGATWTTDNHSPEAQNDTITTTNMNLVKTGNIITGVNAVADAGGDGVTRVEYVVHNGTRYDIVAGRGVDINLGDGSTVQIGWDGAYTMSAANRQTGLATLTYGLVDNDGDRDTASINLSWQDRAPNATDDIDSFIAKLTDVANGRVTATINASINAAGLSFGDNGNISLLSDARGSFGTLYINPNGTYTYILDAAKDDLIAAYKNTGIPPRDIFTYEIMDADGDSSEATLTLEIRDDGGVTWELDNISPIAGEGDGGTSIGEVAITGNIISSLVTSGNGIKTIASISINGGAAITVGETDSVHAGTYGTFTIRADGTYSYVGRDDAQGTDSITYTVRDADGDTDIGILKLGAMDSAPVAVDDYIQTTNMVMSASGNLIQQNDQLGDGSIRVKSVLGFDIQVGGSYTFDNLQYKLTVHSDGRYQFISKNGQSNDLPAYPYIIIDQDGDESAGQIHLKYSDLLPIALDDLNVISGQLTDLTNQRVTSVTTATIAAAINQPGSSLGDHGTFTLISPAKGVYGSIVLDTNGVYTYTLDTSKDDLIRAYRSTGSNPEDIFTYRIMDEDGDISEAALVLRVQDDGGVTWTLNNKNPSIDDVTNGLIATELTAITGTVPITAGDGATTLSVNGVVISTAGTRIDSTNGILTIDLDGRYNYIAKDGADGSDTFTLIVTDQDGDRDTATLTLTGRDLHPVVGAVTASGSGDGSTEIVITGDLLERSSSGDGALRVASVFGHVVPAGGVLTLTGTDLNNPGSITSLTVYSNGSYTLVAPKGASVGGSLSFSVVDADGDQSNGSFNLSIDNRDATASTPSVWVDSLNISEDQTGRLMIHATNNDPDSEQLTVTATIPAGWTIVDAAGGTVSGNVWTRALGVGENLNGGPILQPPANWNGSSNIPVSAVSYEQSNGAPSATVSANASVTVTAVNDAPIILALASTPIVYEHLDARDVVQMQYQDSDAGDRIIWSIVGGDTSKFVIDSNTGMIRTTGELNYETATGGYDLKIRATDASGAISERDIHIDVGDQNEAPYITALSSWPIVNENQGPVNVVQMEHNDPDIGDRVTWSIVGGDTSKFVIDSNTGMVRTTGGLDREATPGGYDLKIRATDSSGRVQERDIHVDVGNINETGSISGPVSATVNENQEVTTYVTQMTLSGDPEGDVPSWSIIGGTGADRFTIDPNSGIIRTAYQFNYEDQNALKTYTLTVQADDGHGGRVTKDVTVNIGNVDEAPTITSGTSGSVDENYTGVFMTLAATDPDGDPIIWSLSGRDANRFIIDANSGQIRASGSGLDYETRPSDGYQVTAMATSSGGMESKALSIAVNDVPENHIPITNVDYAKSGNVLANDIVHDGPVNPDGTSGRIVRIVYEILGPNFEVLSRSMDIPQDGTSITITGVYINSPTQTGSFTIDMYGNYSLNEPAVFDRGTRIDYMEIGYVVQDANGDQVGGMVQYNGYSFGNVNEPPTITSGTSGSVDENYTGVFMTLAATDPDGDPITWSLSGRDAGRFIIDSNGNIRASGSGLDYETRPSDEYQVTAMATSSGGMESKALSIAVNDVPENHIPITNVDYAKSGNVLANDIVFDGPVNPDGTSGRIVSIEYEILSHPGPNFEILVGNISIPTDGTFVTVKDVFIGSTFKMGTFTINMYGEYHLTTTPAYTNGGDRIDYMHVSYVLEDANGDQVVGWVQYNPPTVGPLVVDLNRDGIEMLSIDAGITFDMTNDGVKDHTGWVGADDGQLALDLNGNGMIDNQHELFGSPAGSPLEINGFTELASYDDNGDGRVSSMDSIWSKLIVWQDLNQDGISQSNELKSVMEYEIALIDTAATRVNETVAGNNIYWDGNITMNDGSSMDIVDAYYQVVDGATSTTGSDTSSDTPIIASTIIADPSSIDAAISSTLVDQLSSSETSDIDAAIHEFLIATEGKGNNLATDLVDTMPVRDEVMPGSLMTILPPDDNQVL